MSNIDFEKLNADELWNYCLAEYNNNNFLVKLLINRFFDTLKIIIREFDSNISILEVGCGAGESSKYIYSFLKGQHFEISDVDERYIHKLKQLNLPYQSSIESVYELKRKDNEFGCVIMLEVLEHLENVNKALNELFRVSSKYVIISVPNEPLWRILNIMRFKYVKNFGNTPGHINHWSRKKIIALLSNYGKVLKVFSPIPWIIVLVEKSK